MRTTLTYVAVTTLLVSSHAMATDPERPEHSPVFTEIDANNDLYIDKEEFEAFSAKMREAAKERFGGDKGARFRGRGDRMAQLYAEADADGDSLLNEHEFYAMQALIAEKRERWKQKGQR